MRYKIRKKNIRFIECLYTLKIMLCFTMHVFMLLKIKQ